MEPSGDYLVDTPERRQSTSLDPLRRASNLADGLEVVFAEKNLEAAVREELVHVRDHQGRPEDPLTRADLTELGELCARNEGKKDLSGLEYAVNLEELDLSYRFGPGERYNEITDISPLASLALFLDADGFP